MGLPIDDEGSLKSHSSFILGEEEVVTYSMVYLAYRMVNWINCASNTDSPSVSGDSQTYRERLIAQYTSIEGELAHIRKNLPSSFHPDTVWASKVDRTSQATPTDAGVREVWYSNWQCSLAMLYCHMARILMLVHRPAELPLDSASNPSPSRPKSHYDLMLDYRRLEEEIRKNSYEIMSIALSHPEDAVRSRSIQPIYVGGRPLTNSNDRKIVVQLLKSLERDLGIFTRYRIDELLLEWNISWQQLGLADDAS
jgi:hypothetical protein